MQYPKKVTTLGWRRREAMLISDWIIWPSDRASQFLDGFTTVTPALHPPHTIALTLCQRCIRGRSTLDTRFGMQYFFTATCAAQA